jgi:hypothetical protein
LYRYLPSVEATTTSVLAAHKHSCT